MKPESSDKRCISNNMSQHHLKECPPSHMDV